MNVPRNDSPDTIADKTRSACRRRADIIPAGASVSLWLGSDLIAQSASNAVVILGGHHRMSALVPLAAWTGLEPTFWVANTRVKRSSAAALVLEFNHDVMSGRADTVNSKVAPRGTFALAHRRPPCASMIDRQIDRPIPKPLDFVV